MFNWWSPVSGVTRTPRTVQFGQKTKPASLDNVFRTLSQLGNDNLDHFFYNLEKCDLDRVQRMSGEQGSIIYVPADRNADLVECADATELFERFPDVGAISVAGVGSSAAGAVGLARDVADSTKMSVAAVVSGRGLFEAAWEGMGAWMVLRENNQLEFWLEKFRNSMFATGMFPGFQPLIETWDSIGCGPEIVTLKSLLRRNQFGQSRLRGLKMIVGHSKGNLVISSALSELTLEKKLAELGEVNVVLLGAVTALPPGVGRQHQYLGTMDGLGMMNSRVGVNYKPVPGATHWLNRRLPFHLDARTAIGEVARLGQPRKQAYNIALARSSASF
jgi:hypothetical protein